MQTAERLRAQLEDALAVLSAGDAPAAERSAKAVSAMVRALRDVTDLAAAETAQPEEDDETKRARLFGRIRRLVEADAAGEPDELLLRIGRGLD